MTNEEKILAKLDKHDELFEKMLDQMAQMQAAQTQMQTDIAGMKGDIAGMKGDIAGMEGDVAGMKGDIAGLKDAQSTMQTTLTRVAVTQENIVLKGLDALAEGQDLIHQRLKGLAGKDELAEMQEEMRLIRTVIAQHSRGIEELKAAK